jgi:hypothetical protein
VQHKSEVSEGIIRETSCCDDVLAPEAKDSRWTVRMRLILRM